MRRPFVLVSLVVLTGCGDLGCSKRESPLVGSYSDVVRSVQPDVPVSETRKALACAEAFAVADAEPAQPTAPVDGGPEESIDALMERLEKREAQLDRLDRAALVKQADDFELHSAVVRRIEAAQRRGEALSEPERDALVLLELDGEVSNGGLHQYFFNSSGDEAVAARAALARLAFAEYLRIFDCALTAFPDSKPAADRDERNGQLARWGDVQFELFDALDRAWYRRSEDLTTPLVKLMRAKPDAFPSAAKPLHR